MILKPLPQYFIIKINIEEQKKRKEKIGSLYVHTSHAFMQRNMQIGEIIAIGNIASKQFPEAKVNDMLIFHHFVEGSEKEKSNMIHADDEFYYYNVTALEFNGHRNETFGIYRNGEIIPHPDFVFIEPAQKPKQITADEFIEQNTKQVGNIILFNNWKETREQKEEKSKTIMEEIKSQSKGKNLSDSVKRGLSEKQYEAEKLTASLSKQQYIPLKVAFAHPSLKAKEKVYSLNIGSQMTLEVEGKEYIVIHTKYVAATG